MRTQHLCVTACLKSKLSTVQSVSVKYTACIYFFSTFTSSVFYLVLLQGKKKSLPRTGENKSLQWSGFFVTRQVKKWLQRDKDVRCRAGTKKTETDHLKRASMRSQTNLGRWTNLFTLQSARDNEPRGTGSRVSVLEASEIHNHLSQRRKKSWEKPWHSWSPMILWFGFRV